MDIKDILIDCDALTQARLIREKHITSEELILASIDRIEAINPLINAVITKLYERALRGIKECKRGRFLQVCPF